ncbi:DNA-binding FadR family transcriptional regulator [Pseudochelatococcus lubricantis]|uniref:DNA-binding FadR family transcriptional regulator n=1 Tax=Pseudochelatococcus lubricantis TaxID=1538102 RepID=A0ABX0V1I3_9HYPH|nr:FadR/GntR family transcriptional regulator [Pseudochelatococcus lubricantis]NIJ59059.1 DNA-binding FadR family transcriptional regulator [Pseudochelatococcus lubricantis]
MTVFVAIARIGSAHGRSKVKEKLVAKRKPLSTMVADSLSEKVRSGALAPGAQLATEAELGAEYNVSRTVVREAIARLRSAGLVIPRQGKGIFVSEAPHQQGFMIPAEALATLPETIALLELRLSVEVESAGLCAQRRTDEEARAIRSLMEQVDALHEDPEQVQIHYDYDFHLKIAECTRNEFIFGFLDYLRPIIAPRFRLGHIVASEYKEAYYARIHAEHDSIVAAIERRDAPAAREAMRQHLQNSLERVRALALATGINADDATQPQASGTLFAGLKIPAGG